MKTLKAPLMMVTVAALALSSCSEDEPVSVNQGRAIDFRTAMDSRAVETTNLNLSSIQVAAFLNNQLFFPDMAYTKGSDDFFTSTTEYHWPGDDSQLTFYAYSPANPGGTVTLTADAKTMTDFSPAADLANQIDFITATATGTKSSNEASGVPLKFNHQLAQIEVRAKSDNKVYTFSISGVRIGQPVSKGSFDFVKADWTLGTDKAIYTDTYSTPKVITGTAASVMGNGGNAMILPQQLTAWDPKADAANTAKGAYLSVKLNVATTETGVQVYPFPSDGNCQ